MRREGVCERKGKTAVRVLHKKQTLAGTATIRKEAAPLRERMTADAAALKRALDSGEGAELRAVWALLHGAPRDFFAELAADPALWPLVAEWARQARDAVLFRHDQFRLLQVSCNSPPTQAAPQAQKHAHTNRKRSCTSSISSGGGGRRRRSRCGGRGGCPRRDGTRRTDQRRLLLLVASLRGTCGATRGCCASPKLFRHHRQHRTASRASEHACGAPRHNPSSCAAW